MKKAEGCFPRPCFSIRYVQFFPILTDFPPEPLLFELLPLFCFGVTVLGLTPVPDEGLAPLPVEEPDAFNL